MGTRNQSIEKRNFKSESEYFSFAKEVGKKIHYSKIRNKVLKLSAQKIRNANTLISEYYSINNSETYTKSDVIADFIQKTTMQSFLRYSDKAHLTSKIENNFIENEGVELDLQAIEMNEFYQMGVTPDDIVEFIQNNEKGVKSYQSTKELEAEKVADTFLRRYDIKINSDFVKRYYMQYLQQNSDIGQSEDCPF
jgi:hypothetical protein